MPGRACAIFLKRGITFWPALADVSMNMTSLYSFARASPSSVLTSLRVSSAHVPLIAQVCLVADERDDHVVASLGAHVFHPL